MFKRIVFRNMEHSTVLENYVNEQFAKVEEFLASEREPIYIDIVLIACKDHAHDEAEIVLKSPHYNLVSKYEGPKMYDVIDRVIDTLYLALREAKKKIMEQARDEDYYKSA